MYLRVWGARDGGFHSRSFLGHWHLFFLGRALSCSQAFNCNLKSHSHNKFVNKCSQMIPLMAVSITWCLGSSSQVDVSPSGDSHSVPPQSCWELLASLYLSIFTKALAGQCFWLLSSYSTYMEQWQPQICPTNLPHNTQWIVSPFGKAIKNGQIDSLYLDYLLSAHC